MRILCIGDVVGRIGRDMLFRYAEDLKYQKNIDLIIANGENSSHGRGITYSTYNEMTRAGVEGFTMGNHTWNTKEAAVILEKEDNIIRPANFGKDCPGRGSMIITANNGIKVGIVNVIGRTYMEPCDSPFDAAEREVQKLSEKTKIILVDFHAEATSEKEAMGYFMDGKVSAVFGTHTHVQTADDKILESGTGYITDLGMTGAVNSVLGIDPEQSIGKFMGDPPRRYESAKGPVKLEGCIFEIDPQNGRCLRAEGVRLK